MPFKRKPLTKEKALDKLETLCSRAEQCESEVVKKMILWGIPSSDRNDIIEYLKENRYLDDSRYARSYAHDKAKFSSWGPGKIRMELIRRKIPFATISEALNGIDNTVWKEGLLKTAESKARHLDLIGEESYEDTRKLYRYILSRGFSSVAASKVIAYLKKREREK